MSASSTQWQAIRWSIGCLRQVRFHHLSFVGGLALAAGAAVSMGALGDSPAQSIPVRSEQAVASSTGEYDRWAVDHVVLFLIRSSAVIDGEMSLADEAVGGVSQARSYRVVETHEDEIKLEAEMNEMFYNGVSYGVVDLRRPLTESP